MPAERSAKVLLGEGGVGLTYESRDGIGLLNETVRLYQQTNPDQSLTTVALFEPQQGRRVLQTLYAATATPNSEVRLEAAIGDWNLPERRNTQVNAQELFYQHSGEGDGGGREEFAPEFSAAFLQFIRHDVSQFLQTAREAQYDLYSEVRKIIFFDGNIDYKRIINNPGNLLEIADRIYQANPEGFLSFFGITEEDVQQQNNLRLLEEPEGKWRIASAVEVLINRGVDPLLALDPNARVKTYDYSRLKTEEDYEKRMHADWLKADKRAKVELIRYIESLSPQARGEVLGKAFYERGDARVIDIANATSYLSQRFYGMFPSIQINISTDEVTFSLGDYTIKVILGDKLGNNTFFPVKEIIAPEPDKLQIIPVLAWQTYQENGQVRRRLLSVDDTLQEAKVLLGQEQAHPTRRNIGISSALGRSIAVALSPQMRGKIPERMFGQQRIQDVQVGVLFEDQFASSYLTNATIGAFLSGLEQALQ